MDNLELVFYAAAGLAMSVFSGIAGGGGGFVMTPLAIFLGLSPAQAVSTSKITGFSLTVGALVGMRKSHGHVSKARIIPVMILAIAVGLVVPFVIVAFDSALYRNVLGIILLLMIPIMLIKKVGVKPHHPKLWQKYAGGGLLALAMFLQGVFSGGLGTLVNVVLMGMMGMTALEANLTKRWSQLLLNGTIVIGVLGTGLIVWKVALVGVVMTLIGGYVGGRVAVHKGDGFVVGILIALMFVSALGLIFGG